MDLRSGCLECKLDLNAVVDMLHSYRRKIQRFALNLVVSIDIGWSRMGAEDLPTSEGPYHSHQTCFNLLRYTSKYLHGICDRVQRC